MMNLQGKLKKNISWYLWHPHQGLWNKNIRGKVRSLFPKPLAETTLKIVFFLDTLILWFRVLLKRISRLGLVTTIKLSFFAKNQKICPDVPLLYLDLGTHKKANEIYWMINSVLPNIADNYQIYGFEASPKTFTEAKQRLGDNENITLVNKALCLTVPPDGKLKFYTDSENYGVGSSLYRSRFQTYEEVDATKFSDWIREQNLDLEKSVTLLRMNIEGAEFDVILDLIESKLTQYIDGYFGAWDDVEKIDPKKDEEFRVILKENHIEKIPFHEGDIRSPLRASAIKYQIITCVYSGMQRIKQDD